jgi:hypothetical protein
MKVQKLLMVGTALLCFSLNSVAQTPTPNSTWSPQFTVTDCSGTTSYTVAESSNGCQSYNTDIYENWDSQGNGARDTDIASFGVGYDDNFFYFQHDLRDNWNYDGTGQSKQYQIDLDTDFASGGDARSDFLITYDPLTTHVGSTWTAEGGSKVTIYRDANNNAGGPSLSLSDWNSCSGCDGFESDVSLSSTNAYVRIVNGNIEMAIRRSVFNSTDSSDQIRARAWATQTSTLDKSKHFFHDQNKSSDLASNRMDNTASANTDQWQSFGSGVATQTQSSGSGDTSQTQSNINIAD